MKIKFTMKQNGRVSVDNKAQFDALIINDEQYNVVASVAKKLNKSVFDIFPEPAKIAWAVIPGENGVNKVIRVFVIRTECRAIKLVFESRDNVEGVRMYIEDGDVLYTTAREANLAAVASEEEKKDDEDVTLADVFNALGSIFGDIVSNFDTFKEKYQAKKREEQQSETADKGDILDGLYRESEEDAEEDAGSDNECPTDRDRVETLLADARARRQKLLKEQSAVLNRLKNVKREIEQLEAELQNL